MSMTKEEAQREIQRLINEAQVNVSEAERIADEHKLEFSWRAAYGMGGWYQGDPDQRSEDAEDGWQASSNSC